MLCAAFTLEAIRRERPLFYKCEDPLAGAAKGSFPPLETDLGRMT